MSALHVSFPEVPLFPYVSLLSLYCWVLLLQSISIPTFSLAPPSFPLHVVLFPFMSFYILPSSLIISYHLLSSFIILYPIFYPIFYPFSFLSRSNVPRMSPAFPVSSFPFTSGHCCFPSPAWPCVSLRFAVTPPPLMHALLLHLMFHFLLFSHLFPKVSPPLRYFAALFCDVCVSACLRTCPLR